MQAKPNIQYSDAEAIQFGFALVNLIRKQIAGEYMDDSIYFAPTSPKNIQFYEEEIDKLETIFKTKNDLNSLAILMLAEVRFFCLFDCKNILFILKTFQQKSLIKYVALTTIMVRDRKKFLGAAN